MEIQEKVEEIRYNEKGMIIEVMEVF